MGILKKYRYDIKDLDCAHCAKKLENEFNNIEGITNCIVNFGTSKLSLESDLKNPIDTLRKIASEVEPDCTIEEEVKKENEKQKEKKYEIPRLIVGIILAIIGFTNCLRYVWQGEQNSNLVFIISTICIISSYIVLLYRTIKKAIKQLKGHIIDENSLIVISCIGAYLVGKHHEGLMVILLFEIGKILEGKAIAKSRKSIKDLMDIKPEYANLMGKDGATKRVNPDQVNIGDTIVVKKGEKIPLDGIITKGTSILNTSAITGESKLYDVKENDEVLSGSINQGGIIEIQVIKEYKNSTANKIIELVEKATDRKAKTENFVSKGARIYTPAVIIIAVIVASVFPIIFKQITYSQSIYRALTFLVIACPCSIAISVPLSYFSGIGRASKEGILVKGSDYLDGLKDINKIIFDKTGTITTGNFEIQKITSIDRNLNDNELLRYYALGESFSNHPIAKTILEKYKGEIVTEGIHNYQEIAGKGITYELEGKRIKIGNVDFTESKFKIEETGTIIFLSIDGDTKGYVVLGDKLKENIPTTIKELSEIGIDTMMFTGDNEEEAIKIAKEAGIREIKSQMLPQDKFNELEKIITNYDKNKKIAFVGDGINDGPVLARADIGISMGGVGASSSIEASDVVIMTDEIEKIIEGINISKKTSIIIKQNLFFAIGVKVLVLILSAFGITDMWEAVFADVGTTIITIFNTLRILK